MREGATTGYSPIVRLEQICDLMRTLKFVRGQTFRELAKEWSIAFDASTAHLRRQPPAPPIAVAIALMVGASDAIVASI